MAEQRQSRAGMPARILLLVAALAVVGMAAWLYGRPPTAETPASAAGQAPASSPGAVAVAVAGSSPAASAVISPGAAPVSHPAAAASAPAWASSASAAVAAAMEKLRSPAEALRKVQLGLNGGTPDEVLEAARTLQMCSFMAGAPEAMYAMRDRPDGMPEGMRKSMEAQGGINKMIENAQTEARRCQVFDAATMGRRMELFQRALDGGAEGAAAEYLMALQNPLEKKADPALIAKLQAEVRNAAASGDALALQHMSLSTGDRATELGVTPVQRAAYGAAWKIIMEERRPGITAIIEKAMAPFAPASAPPLSTADQAEADALARQVVDTWRRNRKGG